jgi:chaperonin GroES
MAHTSSRRPQTGVAAPKCRQQLKCHAAAATAEATQQLEVTKMSPLGDRLLVKPVEEEASTSGGLLLTAGATKAVQDAVIGEVLALGDDVDIGVKKGDKVLFSKYSTSDVKVDDGEVCFVAQKSILATLS